MSAPQTNVEKQSRRHRGVLIGIALAAAFGVLMFLLNSYNTVEEAPAEVPVDTPTE